MSRGKIGSAAWAKEKNKREGKGASGGGRTPQEAALGQSMAAAGNPVSATNLTANPSYSAPAYTGPAPRSPVERPQSLTAQLSSIASPIDARSNLALPSRVIESALDQIKEAPKPDIISVDRPVKYGKTDLELVNSALKTLAPAAEIKQTGQGKVVTGFRVKGKKPGKTSTRPTFGQPTVRQLVDAAESNKLRVTRKGRLGVGQQPVVTREPGQGLSMNRKRQVALARKILAAKHEFRTAGGGKINIPGAEGTFVNEVARQTGLSPKVVAAWTRQEGGNSTGDWNRLNIGHTDSGPISLTADGGWSDPKAAAGLTAQFLKGQYGGASQGIQNILPLAKGKNDQQQIDIIAGSGWATDPNYRENISNVYQDTPNAMPTQGGKKARATAKAEWLRLVDRGKMFGVYEVPEGGKPTLKPTMWRLPKKSQMKRGKMVAAGADPYTDGTDQDVIRLGEAMSMWVGQPLEISSANRPDQGYDSDHLYGSALDVPVLAVSEGGTAESEAYGDRVAAAAVMAAGGTKEQAAGIRQGIDQTVTSPNGARVQVLWKTSTGGNHFNHVHVGIAPDSATEMPFVDRSQPMSPMQQVKSVRAAAAAGAAGASSGGGLVDPGTGMTISQATDILAGNSAAPSQQESLVGLGNYSGSITSANLPQAYVDLIMSAGSAGETGLLDEFLKGRR